MGYASLYAQGAKKRPSTMTQDKILGRGKGLDRGQGEKRSATLKTLFEEAKKEIALVYLPETMAHIRKHNKALYDEMLVIEMRLDDLWLTMKKGENAHDKFREALKTWRDLHLEAVEIYRGMVNRKDL